MTNLILTVLLFFASHASACFGAKKSGPPEFKALIKITRIEKSLNEVCYFVGNSLITGSTNGNIILEWYKSRYDLKEAMFRIDRYKCEDVPKVFEAKIRVNCTDNQSNLFGLERIFKALFGLEKIAENFKVVNIYPTSVDESVFQKNK